MSEARDQILARIRGSLKRGRVDAAREMELHDRVAAPRRNLVPARAAALDARSRIDLFISMAEEVQATTVRVGSLAAVPEAVAHYLAAQNLPAELVLAPDPSLDEIPRRARPLLRIRRGRAEARGAGTRAPALLAVGHGRR